MRAYGRVCDDPVRRLDTHRLREIARRKAYQYDLVEARTIARRTACILRINSQRRAAQWNIFGTHDGAFAISIGKYEAISGLRPRAARIGLCDGDVRRETAYAGRDNAFEHGAAACERRRGHGRRN